MAKNALVPTSADTARERILTAAYDLFSRRGIQDVGIDELVARAPVAKATFYRHFASKDDLALSFLERRDEIWTSRDVIAEVRRRESAPVERLLAIFDVLDEWFQHRDFEGCSFINVLLEMGSTHTLGRASIDYLAKIRVHVRTLAEEADLNDPVEFAHSWQLLMKGSIVSAAEGDRVAANRARQMAVWLIDYHQKNDDTTNTPDPGNPPMDCSGGW
ncbi:AcrR family transcriptional regulator [Arthrobacter sp. CAN_A214]